MFFFYVIWRLVLLHWCSTLICSSWWCNIKRWRRDTTSQWHDKILTNPPIVSGLCVCVCVCVVPLCRWGRGEKLDTQADQTSHRGKSEWSLLSCTFKRFSLLFALYKHLKRSSSEGGKRGTRRRLILSMPPTLLGYYYYRTTSNGGVPLKRHIPLAPNRTVKTRGSYTRFSKDCRRQITPHLEKKVWTASTYCFYNPHTELLCCPHFFHLFKENKQNRSHFCNIKKTLYLIASSTRLAPVSRQTNCIHKFLS